MARRESFVARFVSQSFLFSSFHCGGFLHTVLPVLAVVILSLLAASANAAVLRYQPRAGSKIAYEVEMVAELPDYIETSKGVISYEVVQSDDTIKLDYRGGLGKSRKSKESSNVDANSPRFGRAAMAGTSYGGFGRVKSHISLTPQGGVRTLEGNTQLPYLLGDLALLVFEPLGETEQNSWISEHGVSIFENKSSGWPGRGFPPFRTSSMPDKTTSGSESTSFTFESDRGNVSTFKKSYRLHSAEEQESYDITGEGVWAFNRSLNMPESHDCKYSMVYKKGNLTLSIPVTIKYRRLSEEEFAKIEKEQNEQERQSKEELEKRLDYMQSPLEGDERKKVLAGLKSDDPAILRKVLDEISIKNENEDAEVANAIRRHLQSSDFHVRRSAEKALPKFEPGISRKIKLNEEYSGMGAVENKGPRVTDKTPLPAGLIVAASDFAPFYHSAKVIATNKNGYVTVQIRNHAKLLRRSQLFLAPPEVDQPFVSKKVLERIYGNNFAGNAPADNENEDEEAAVEDGEDGNVTVSKADRDYRTWTDSSGTFAVVAKYVGSHGDKVVLKKKADDKEIRVPLNRLSKPDRAVAERLQKAPEASNPFE